MAAPARRRGGALRARTELDAAGARLAAFDLLARKSWTESELTGRLQRRGAPAPVAKAVVAQLTARGYVDDADFARTWAEARAKSRHIGPGRLTRELAAKGVAPALVAAAVERAFADVGAPARAREAAARRLPALLRRNPGQAPLRLRDFLLRRGYSGGVVRSVVRELTGLAAEPDSGEEAGV